MAERVMRTDMHRIALRPSIALSSSPDSPLYLATGGEDSRMLVWQTQPLAFFTGLSSGTSDASLFPLMKTPLSEHDQFFCAFRGHTGPVSTVSWSPTLSGVLASASDDATIKIWGP